MTRISIEVPEEPLNVHMTVKMTETTRDKIKALAAEDNTTAAALVREAVTMYVQVLEGQYKLVKPGQGLPQGKPSRGSRLRRVQKPK